MTPGTAAARRKTVSFGTHVQDNEGKRQGKSGLPDSCPGKFPSPFTKSIEAENSKAEFADKSRGRNTLTEKLEQVRDESAKRKSVSSRQPTEPARQYDASPNAADSGSDHWKIMFEQYRERSERECRKLVSKQRAAKSFAREKDVQLMETADQLRQEKKKVDRLERQVADLQAQLKEFQEKLRLSQAEEQSAKDEATRSKRGSGITGYRRHGDVTAAASARAQEPEKPVQETGLKTRSSKERLATYDLKSTTLAGSRDIPTMPRVRTRPPPKTEREDVWAQPLAESSLIPTRPETLPPSPSPKASQASTSTLPLKSLAINTLPQESFSVALSMGLQPPSPQRDPRSDSPMHSPTRSRPKLKENLSITVPDISTFLPDAENERPNVLTGTPVPIRSPVLSPRGAAASTAKDSGSPTLKVPRRSHRENVGPKYTSQISIERSEMDEYMRIARSRIAEKGRTVS